MLFGPVFLMYLVFWLVVVPFGLYFIIRTAVEHGIRRSRSDPAARHNVGVEQNRQGHF